MKAFVINSYAHPSKVALTEHAPLPILKPGQVLVDVYSAGLNFFDNLQSQGKYQKQPPFPFILGAEFAGRIAADSPIPEGCPFKPGDRVFGSEQGSYAEKVAADWKNLVPLPDKLSYDQGAGLYITWPTSYEALVGRAALKPGEWVLVLAAAGGVGLCAVQLAKALGAKVIAAGGSPSKLEVAIRYGGADHAVDYNQEGWQKEVLKITGGKGVDVVYDPVGRIRDCTKCIAWKGRAVVVGFASFPPGKSELLALNVVLLKNIAVTGIHWGEYANREPSRVPVVWKELLELLESGRVEPILYHEKYSLASLAQGIEAIQQRRTYGKAIVRIRESDEKVQAKL